MSRKTQKVDKSRTQRFFRLVLSSFDPRAWAHGFKIMNYYNYTHVQELRKATLGKSVAISPTASFANAHNIVLKDRVRIGANSSLWAGPGNACIVVGEDTMIAPNVMLTAANYRFNDGSPISKQAMDEGEITVGRDVWIGSGTIVLAGATIGDGAVIGAGAIVRGEVPENAVISGHPAKAVGYRMHAGAQGAEPAAESASADQKEPVANPSVLAFIRAEMPRLEDAQLSVPMEESGVDSFDLISLRTAIEEKFGTSIPDGDWAGIANLGEIAKLPALRPRPCSGPKQASPLQAVATPLGTIDNPPNPSNGAAAGPHHESTPGRSRRRFAVNMPQMALSGLSESWLFKELGDTHWHMITEFLRSPSSAIVDDMGDRLYATFTRITLDVTPSLFGFKENSALEIDSFLERYGASFFFGNHKLEGPQASGRAKTMSTFAKYGEHGKNTTLIKGTPTIVDHDSVPSMTEFPAFGAEYRNRRSKEAPETIFECEYDILPPHDINGVGLLYFAAYPTVFDLCIEQYEGKGFLIGHSTVSKDICYYANSDPTDTLLFRLHSQEEEGDLVRHTASLCRQMDGKRMAEITSVKRRL